MIEIGFEFPVQKIFLFPKAYTLSLCAMLLKSKKYKMSFEEEESASMHLLKEGKYLIHFSTHIVKYVAQRRNSPNIPWTNWKKYL